MGSTAKDIQVGHHLSLKEGPGMGLEFTILPAGQAGLEVIAVADEYVVVQGQQPGNRCRYPKWILRPPDPAPKTVPEAA